MTTYNTQSQYVKTKFGKIENKTNHCQTSQCFSGFVTEKSQYLNIKQLLIYYTFT